MPPTLLQQALDEQQKQLQAVPEGSLVLVWKATANPTNADVAIGLAKRGKNGQWGVSSDFGMSKNKGYYATGSGFVIIK